jgi:phenylpropionate dioxygenase-like ring-hydroxylating dioxygenase large terminal subunit
MDAKASARLRADAQDMLGHLRAGSIRQAPAIMEVPVDGYRDPDRFQQELRGIFRCLPLMLAASCELGAAGDYKTLEVAGVPVLLMRGRDGRARAFLNSCTHRGSKLARDCGHVARFTCPYHAWTFSTEGRLVAIAAKERFGEADAGRLALIELPLHEQSGLIWVVLDPGADVDFDAFLGDFGRMLGGFDFGRWSFFERRTLAGANWKLAFDAHLEFYHLPVLHRNTFGADISPLAQYYYYGPHQRLGHVATHAHVLEQDALLSLADRPVEEWPIDPLMFGEWIVFPNVSINCFYRGGRGVIISQVFPGETAEQSFTVQTYLLERQPDAASAGVSAETAAFLERVVRDEDMPMSLDQQQVLKAGLLRKYVLGRNEGGLQHFHRWIDHCLAGESRRSMLELMASAPAPPLQQA